MVTWLIFVLPLAAAALGALASWLSLRLLFGPLPFAGRLAPALVLDGDLVLDRLADGLGRSLRPGELFRLMEPEKIAAAVAQAVNGRLDEHVDEIMRERHSVLWDNLPQLARQRVYARVDRQLPSILDNLVEELAEHMDEFTDLRDLLRDAIVARRDLLAGLLQEALAEECAFLRRAGVMAGLAVGVFQLFVWLHYPAPWMQVALAVGVVLAAVELPRRLLYRGGRIPGTEHRVGDGLAEVFSRRLAGEVLSARHLLHAVVTGPRAGRARSIIRRHMRPLLETGLVRTTFQLLVGAQGYAHIKHLVTERITALTVDTLGEGYVDRRQGTRIEDACRQRLQALPPAEVRALLQPVLDDGLWWRITTVLLLGLVAGLIEAWALAGIAG